MDSDSWSRLSSASKPRCDLYIGFEEEDGAEEELRVEFACPFCCEDFDIVGLCCHLEVEHPTEAKNGVCPVCVEFVGIDLVGHLSVQHSNLFKMQRKRRFRKGSATLNSLRKEMFDGNFNSYFAPQASLAPDPLLSSFISNLWAVDLAREEQSEPSDERDAESVDLQEETVESVKPCIREEDQEERERRSDFVRGLVFSTIFEFDDDFL